MKPLTTAPGPRFPRRLCELAALLLVMSSVTCLVPDANHCAHRSGPDRGHAWCAQQFPERPLCSRCVSAGANAYSGCVDEEPDATCLVGAPQLDEDAEPSTGQPTDSSDDPGTTAAEGCTPSGCEAIDPSTPACNEHGECVTCTRSDPGACLGATPICDEEAQQCLPCSLHSQCLQAVGSACHLKRGECLPPDRVWHVQGDVAAGGDGSEAAPFRTITEAMARIPPAAPGTPAGQGTIVLHEASEVYDEVITISGNRLVAVVAPGNERPRIELDTASALVTVVDHDSIAYLEGLSLQSNLSGPGLRIQGARAYVDRCELTRNLAGLEVLEDGALELRNSIVTAGKDDAVAVLVDTATATIAYSTVVHTGPSASTAVPDALRCTSTYDVSVRNSVVLSVDEDGSGWNCFDAEVSHSATEGVVPGTDNVPLCDAGLDCTMDILPQLFVSSTDLRLDPSGASLLAGIPVLAAGDPPFDIDLNPRSTPSGTDHAGAHAPP